MEITKPLDDHELYVVYDVFDPELVKKFVNVYTARALYSESNGGKVVVNEVDRHHLGTTLLMPEDMFGIENEDDHFKQMVETLQQIMMDLYPDVKVARQDAETGIVIRAPGGGLLQGLMQPHTDGPPENLPPEHGIKSIGGLFYLNDDFDGGELYYPDIGFDFKPVPNSFVIHLGEAPYRHGVREITNGWRFHFGLFSFEEYDPMNWAVYRDSLDNK